MSIQIPDISEFRDVSHEELITESQSEQMKKIQKQIDELPDLMAEVYELLVEQGLVIDKVEENVVKVRESAEEGTRQLDRALKEKNKGQYMWLYGGGGALGGGSLGALGFFGGPVIGATTMVASSILGLAAGTYYSGAKGCG